MVPLRACLLYIVFLQAQNVNPNTYVSAHDNEPYLVFECPVFEDLRREHRQLFGRACEVAFDMRRFFAHL